MFGFTPNMNRRARPSFTLVQEEGSFQIYSETAPEGKALLYFSTQPPAPQPQNVLALARAFRFLCTSWLKSAPRSAILGVKLTLRGSKPWHRQLIRRLKRLRVSRS